MVAISARFLWIVAPGTSFLRAVPGKNGGIYIQCIVIKLKVAKKPLVKWRENMVIYCCSMLIEKALKGFTSSHLIKSPTFAHNLIVASNFAMLKFISTTPNTSHKMFDKLIGRIATIKALNRKRQLIQLPIKIHPLKHVFDQNNA